MKPKEYLSQLRRLRSMAHRIDEEIKALDATMTSVKAIRYDKVNVQSSPTNQMEEEIVRKDELKQKLKDLRDEYYDRYIIICHQIQNMHAIGLYKDILTLRYVDGKGFRKIADELGYSFEYIANSHGKALKQFAEQWLD